MCFKILIESYRIKRCIVILFETCKQERRLHCILLVDWVDKILVNYFIGGLCADVETFEYNIIKQKNNQGTVFVQRYCLCKHKEYVVFLG